MASIHGVLASLERSLRGDRCETMIVGEAVRRVLELLNTQEHDTDQDCRLVDQFVGLHLLEDSLVQERVRRLPSALALIIEDMGMCLHDAHGARAIAEDFGSTPQQLLARLKSFLEEQNQLKPS
jgi:hypothetical protein